MLEVKIVIREQDMLPLSTRRPAIKPFTRKSYRAIFGISYLLEHLEVFNSNGRGPRYALSRWTSKRQYTVAIVLLIAHGISFVVIGATQVIR